MYPVTVPVGGVKLTIALELVVLTIAKLVGGLGKEFVVTGLDAVDATDAPDTLNAVTVNVYVVLALRPVTNIGLDVPVAVILPGKLVTVYCVITPPPVGAVKDTLTSVSLTVVPTILVGEVGKVVTVRIPAGPVPEKLLEYTFRLHTVLVNRFSIR